jgi:hypothetical protein
VPVVDESEGSVDVDIRSEYAGRVVPISRSTLSRSKSLFSSIEAVEISLARLGIFGLDNWASSSPDILVTAEVLNFCTTPGLVDTEFAAVALMAE